MTEQMFTVRKGFGCLRVMAAWCRGYVAGQWLQVITAYVP